MEENKLTHTRTTMLRKNIVFSAVLRLVSIGCSLLIVPVTLGYLDNKIYGIWLTISSILFWFAFFDVGLGNGMRNYLTEAISRDDFESARSYLSTTLVILTFIAIPLAIVSAIVLSIIDVNTMFNTHALSGNELRLIMMIAILFTLALFVIKNIGMVFVALQKYALSDFLTVSGSVLSLLIIYLLTLTTQGSLMLVVLVFTTTPVLLYTIASIPIFAHYPQLRPSLKSLNISVAKTVVKKGLGFFFIQITSCLVIYGSSNLFITHYAGPEAVTTYNIAYKYFHLVAIGYTIVLAPLWNAYTDAYVKEDFSWISKTFHRALMIWGLTVLGSIIMLLLADIFYHLWVGDKVQVPWMVSLSAMLYITFFNLNNCATYLINGLNKIRVQIYTSVIFTIIYLALAPLYGSSYGITGIVLSMAFCYAAMSLIHLYQCHLLITRTSTGIWNK